MQKTKFSLCVSPNPVWRSDANDIFSWRHFRLCNFWWKTSFNGFLNETFGNQNVAVGHRTFFDGFKWVSLFLYFVWQDNWEACINNFLNEQLIWFNQRTIKQLKVYIKMCFLDLLKLLFFSFLSDNVKVRSGSPEKIRKKLPELCR